MSKVNWHKWGRSRFPLHVECPEPWGRWARAARLTPAVPNNRLQATANSLRSCLALAIGGA